MTRQKQMTVVTMVFGVVVALVATYAEGALLPLSMVGGLIVAAGWMFYVDSDSATENVSD